MSAFAFSPTRLPATYDEARATKNVNRRAYEHLPEHLRKNLGKPPHPESKKDLPDYTGRVRAWRKRYARLVDSLDLAPKPKPSRPVVNSAWNSPPLPTDLGPLNRNKRRRLVSENINAWKAIPELLREKLPRPDAWEADQFREGCTRWRKKYNALAWNPPNLPQRLGPVTPEQLIELSAQNLTVWEAMPPRQRKMLPRPNAWGWSEFAQECGRWRGKYNQIVWGFSVQVRTIRAAVLEADKVCRYCLTRPANTVDHVVPRSRGGANTPLNLVGACKSCNLSKADRTPKEAGMVLHLPLRFFALAAPVFHGVA